MSFYYSRFSLKIFLFSLLEITPDVCILVLCYIAAGANVNDGMDVTVTLADGGRCNYRSVGSVRYDIDLVDNRCIDYA